MTITCYPTRCPATRAANPTRVTRVRVARSGRVGCMNWHPDPTQTGHYSLRNIPTKDNVNVIVRLWTYGFHKLLESLRRASFNSPLALEHLQDFLLHSF